MKKYIFFSVAAIFFAFGLFYGIQDLLDGHYLSAVSFVLSGCVAAVTAVIAANDFDAARSFSKYSGGILILLSFLSAFSDSPGANMETSRWNATTLSKLTALSLGQAIGSIDPTYESEQAAVEILSDNLCDFGGSGSAKALVFELLGGLYWKPSQSIAFRFFDSSDDPLDKCFTALQNLNDSQPGVLPESILDTMDLIR